MRNKLADFTLAATSRLCAIAIIAQARLGLPGHIQAALFTGSINRSLPAVQQGAFTDLTAYLSGNALNAYPNLAKIPPISWQNTKIKVKIYGPPRARPLAGAL